MNAGENLPKAAIMVIRTYRTATLHRLQHKYDDFGRANAERPPG
jgi:hypothetical protein